jgi:hypothetical protein
MVMTLLGILLLMVFGTQSVAVNVVATPSTPVAVSTPVVAECMVQPRTVGGVNEIASTARTPGPGTPTLDEVIPYVKPEGTPASSQAIDGVMATIEQFIACANEGEYLRILALFSDDFIHNYAATLGIPLDENDPLITPSPAPEDERALVANVTDVIELPDGRISALATFSASDDPEETALVVFTLDYDLDKERWLIDDFRVVTPEDNQSGWTVVQGEGYEGVLVPEDQGRALIDFYVSGTVRAVWTPSEEIVARLEEDLPSYLEIMAAVTPGISADFIDRLPTYKRQYVGFNQEEDGLALILVNATCAGDDEIWRTQPVIVMDGGDCFFRVIYNPGNRTFSGFEVNGEA